MTPNDLEKTCEFVLEELRNRLSEQLGAPTITPQSLVRAQQAAYAILERLSRELRITPPNITVTQDTVDPSRLIITVPSEFFEKINAIVVYTTETDGSKGAR